MRFIYKKKKKKNPKNLQKKVFDEIIIDGIFSKSNELAKELWKESFGSKWEIPWKEFQKTLALKLRISSSLKQVQFFCLKEFLCPNQQDFVSIENFGSFLEWFGPLKRGVSFLEEFYGIVTSSYFFGYMSAEQATQALASQPVGTFLVRFSAIEPGWFSLSFVTENETVQHSRIEHSPGKPYSLQKKNIEFHSLRDLIQSEKLKEIEDPFPIILSQPLSPNPFLLLLQSFSSSQHLKSVGESTLRLRENLDEKNEE